MDDVEFRVLGAVEVRLGERVVAPSGLRPRAVLALLLLAAGTPVSEARLVDALWGEELPVSARNSLQSHVSRLRTVLGPAGAQLRREPSGYRLEVRPDDLDLHRAQTLAGEARAARPSHPATAARLLAEALSLWRGPALAEFADLPGLETSGLSADRTRLDELRRVLREEMHDARLAAGEHLALIPDLEAAVTADPLREQPHRLLAVALYRSGRAADALATLRRYRDRLADETGLDPTGELAALEAAVLAGDPGLDPPAVPPPPALPGAGRTALRAPPANPFFGRQAERAALAAAVREHRLVTVTGPGGVGKTRLLVETLAEHTGDEIVLLDLGPVPRGPDVLPALAGQLDVRPGPGTTTEQAVLDTLQLRRAVLALDNCEHVAAAVVELVTSVLGRAPEVRVLTTSRRRLGLPEEQVLPLDPLPVPAHVVAEPTGPPPTSVELFVDRARRVRPGFALTPANRGLVAEICRRLDGLPLALELAASMVGALDLQDIAAGLDAQLDLPGRSGAERHRSLRAVVESSFEQLADEERELFAALSVVPDWFDLSTAQAVALPLVDRARVAALMVGLVDASLVLVAELEDGRLRYRMLETLRQYGRERLAHDGDEAAIVARFVSWAVRFAEHAERELLGRNEAAWVRRVEIEFANLRSAWQHAVTSDDLPAAARIAVALSEHARLRVLPEPWQWAIGLARGPERGDDEWAVPLRGAAALASCLLGDPDSAEEHARAGLLRGSGTGRGRWRCLHPLSTARMIRGDHEAAARLSRDAAAEPDCPPVIRAYLQANVGLARSYAGTATEAEIEGPAVTLQGVDWPSGRAWGWYVAAEAVRAADPAECIRRLGQAIDLARAVGSVFIEGVARVGMLAAALRLGDHATALRLFPDVLRGWQRSGSWFQQWTSLRTLAALLAELDAAEPAAVLLGAADTAPEAPAIGGAEEVGYAALHGDLATRLGPARFAAATAWGAAQPRTAIVEYALRAIETVGTPAPAAS